MSDSFSSNSDQFRFKLVLTAFKDKVNVLVAKMCHWIYNTLKTTRRDPRESFAMNLDENK